jgi:hypothetical protein
MPLLILQRDVIVAISKIDQSELSTGEITLWLKIQAGSIHFKDEDFTLQVTLTCGPCELTGTYDCT